MLRSISETGFTRAVHRPRSYSQDRYRSVPVGLTRVCECSVVFGVILMRFNVAIDWPCARPIFALVDTCGSVCRGARLCRIRVGEAEGDTGRAGGVMPCAAERRCPVANGARKPK